jgi:hypothetical protein
MVPPGCIAFLQNLPNKPLTDGAILQNPENKGDNLQDLQNIGVMASLELRGRTQACGWRILSLP